MGLCSVHGISGKTLLDYHFQGRCRWRDYIKRSCRKVGNEGLHSIRVTASGEPLSVLKCLVGMLFKIVLISYFYAHYKFVLPKHSTKHFTVSIQIACCNTLILKKSRITGFYSSCFHCGLSAGYFVEVKK